MSDKSLPTLFEILADEVGIVTGRIEREVKLKVELSLAAVRLAISDIERRDAEREVKLAGFLANLQQRETDLELRIVKMEQATNERLAFLKDGRDGEVGARGEPGTKGDKGDLGERGLIGLTGDKGDIGQSGEAGIKGDKGDPGEQGEAGTKGDKGDPGEQGEAGTKGDNGEPGERGELGPQGLAGERGDPGPAGEMGAMGLAGVAGEAGERGLTGPAGERGGIGPQGLKGDLGECGEVGVKGDKGDLGERGEMGIQGLKGDPGERGSDGKLPQVKAWVEGKVHYENDVVMFGGGTYQALRDTAARFPDSSDDWIALSLPGEDGQNGINGRDGHFFTIRGTYLSSLKYAELDVVTLNSTWFVAKKDNPGECPGPDWQSGPVGKRGDKGERGERGLPGAKGDDGAAGREILGWLFEGYSAIPLLSDGARGPAIEARQWFEMYSDDKDAV